MRKVVLSPETGQNWQGWSMGGGDSDEYLRA